VQKCTFLLTSSFKRVPKQHIHCAVKARLRHTQVRMCARAAGLHAAAREPCRAWKQRGCAPRSPSSCTSALSLDGRSSRARSGSRAGACGGPRQPAGPCAGPCGQQHGRRGGAVQQPGPGAAVGDNTLLAGAHGGVWDRCAPLDAAWLRCSSVQACQQRAVHVQARWCCSGSSSSA